MVKKKCLIVDCDGGWYARSLCRTHYYLALNLTNKGKTTWEALEKKGMAAPRTNDKAYKKFYDQFDK